MKKIAVCVLLALLPIPAWAQDAGAVAQVKSELQARGIDLSGPCGAFEITKRVAWRLKASGAGYLSKPGGNNCQGFSTDYVVFLNGPAVDILGDGGGANNPQWSVDNDPALIARWVAPVNPDPVVVPPLIPGPIATVPAPLPSIDLSGVYAQFSILNAKVDELIRANGDAHAAIHQNISDGRAENRTFFEQVRTQWKAIVGKALVYGGPIIAAIFAGRATK